MPHTPLLTHSATSPFTFGSFLLTFDVTEAVEEYPSSIADDDAETSQSKCYCALLLSNTFQESI